MLPSISASEPHHYNTYRTSAQSKAGQAQASFALPDEEQSQANAELVETDDSAKAASNKAANILLSTQNPFPSSGPFAEEQERFMEFFQKAFDEVLLEKGLSGSAISEEDMNSVQAEVSKKLSRNHEAFQLMTLLQINLEPEGVEESKEDKFYFNLFKEFEKNMYNALGPEGYKEYIDMIQNPKPQIPGLDGYAMTFTHIEPDSLTYSDTVSYKLYVARIHDEVMAELNLDPAQVEEGSPEALQAVRMIGERIMNDPEGQEFLYRLGMNGINSKGMPSAMGISPDGRDTPSRNPDFTDEDFLDELSQRARESAPKKVASWESSMAWGDFVQSMTSELLALNVQLKSNNSLSLLNVR